MSEYDCKLITFTEFFETEAEPIPHGVYNVVTFFLAFLQNGSTTETLPSRTDGLMEDINLSNTEIASPCELLMDAFVLKTQPIRNSKKRKRNQKRALDSPATRVSLHPKQLVSFSRNASFSVSTPTNKISMKNVQFKEKRHT